MEQNKEIETWEDAEKEIASTQHLAMEVLKQEQKRSKAKSVGIISLTVAVIIITIAMAVINYKNDCDWRALFSDYDFISQDGDGINNVNGGEQGDLNNGSKSETEKG